VSRNRCSHKKEGKLKVESRSDELVRFRNERTETEMMEKGEVDQIPL
jgi:hypothetical protein